MTVPLFSIKDQHDELADGFKEAFERVLHSGGYILGQEVESFEMMVAQYLGVKHAIGVSSGTDALILPMMTLDLGPGDEVLCPDFTFLGTAGCVSRVGATPVFVDINEEDFNISIEDLKSKITDKTKAIIPVHLFGQSANMDAIREIAKEHNLYIIEDAAQSIGATYKGQQTGTMGDFGCYSFFPTKNLGALGDAGLVVTNDDELAHKARIMRVHGGESTYFHKYIGGNFRIDALQAALLKVKFPYLDSYVEKRRKNAAYYLEQLKDLEGIILPKEIEGNFHTYNQFTIRVIGEGQRDALRQYLSEKGIGANIYYPLVLSKQECFQGNSRGGENITVAAQVAKECLSIPIFPELKELQLKEVVEGITGFFN